MGSRRIHEVAVRLTALGLLTVVALTGSAALAQPETPPPAAVVAPAEPAASKADYAAVDANTADQQAFDRLLAGLPRVRLDDEGTPRMFYVWEGDMLLSAEEIRATIYARKGGTQPARGAQELLLQLRPDGLPGYWVRGERALTYSLDCTTFAAAGQCDTTRRLFAAATRDWVNSCSSCGITFTEATAANAKPTFRVRFEPDQYAYLAIAFFANDAPFKRIVSVTPGFFTTSFDQTGILRHEIGHILGYRHEHIRGLAGCYTEDGNWQSLTPYDPKSVMHYFCGGGGTKALTLSPTDIAGHRELYRKR